MQTGVGESNHQKYKCRFEVHQPGEATVNAITMSEQRSVGRSKERSDVRGSGLADRVHAVVRAEVSVNAAKARSNTNTSSTTTRL